MLTRDGEPLDFSFMRISQYGKTMLRARSFLTFPPCWTHTIQSGTRPRASAGAAAIWPIPCARPETVRRRKLEARRSELQKTAGREEKRHAADLITANMYRMKKGDEKLVCEDFYAEGSPETTIALDPLKTPQQNAASLYREYNKLKTAESCLGQLIAENEKQLDYLNSVLDEIERAESEKGPCGYKAGAYGHRLHQKAQRGKAGPFQGPGSP
jgi:hypothetical protein